MSLLWSKPSDFKGWAVLALGVLLILLGMPLLIGGVRLIALGGSWYYLPAGIALITSGALLMLRRRLGAVVYGVLFIVPVLWSLFEVGLNGWALVPRIFNLAILLLLVLAALPVLQPAQLVRRFALTGLAGFAVVVVTLGVLLVNAGRPTVHGVVSETSTPVSGTAPMTVGADWPAYGGTHAAQRYSSLARIDRDNVSQLERAWEYRTGDLPAERWGAETTPLKIGDTVYLCSARNILIALDASTGAGPHPAEQARRYLRARSAHRPGTHRCRAAARAGRRR